MLKYTTNTLKKLEALFDEGGFAVRYEKGNFTAGYCLLEHKKVVVINRYYTTEARCGCLVDLLKTIELDADALSPPSLKLLTQLQMENQQRMDFADDTKTETT